MVAVIAIIAAVALPNILGLTESAKRASLIQNAHMVSSTYNAYTKMRGATGQPMPLYSTKEEAVGAVISATGLSVTNTRLGVTNVFRVPIPSTDQIAMDVLTFENGELIFDTGS